VVLERQTEEAVSVWGVRQVRVVWLFKSEGRETDDGGDLEGLAGRGG
jgi:hypothetical protein